MKIKAVSGKVPTMYVCLLLFLVPFGTAEVTTRDIAEVETRNWSSNACDEITVKSSGGAAHYQPHL